MKQKQAGKRWEEGPEGSQPAQRKLSLQSKLKEVRSEPQNLHESQMGCSMLISLCGENTAIGAYWSACLSKQNVPGQ